MLNVESFSKHILSFHSSKVYYSGNEDGGTVQSRKEGLWQMYVFT